MTDFFTDLERELSAAAERPPRRLGGWPATARRGLAASVAIVAFAAALVPSLLILGSGDEPTGSGDSDGVPAVGTVIHKGEGLPPRLEDSTVVATGQTKVAGPWQLESYRGTGLTNPETREELEPAGLRCLQIVLTDPPPTTASNISSQCGEFAKTPGFSRLQKTVPNPGGGRTIDPKTTEILVYGRVPKRAFGVDLRVPGKETTRYEPLEGPPGDRSDYYLIAVPPSLKNARVEWIGPRGRGGSIALLPP